MHIGAKIQKEHPSKDSILIPANARAVPPGIVPRTLGPVVQPMFSYHIHRNQAYNNHSWPHRDAPQMAFRRNSPLSYSAA